MSLPPFEQIVTEHGRLVLRVCRAIVGPHDAEDAWSETFLAALGAYPRLRPDSNVRSWLVTIAHRKALDRARAAARAPLPVGAFPEADGRSPAPDPPDTELWQALAALAPGQRGAVAYHYVADLPYAEVAGLLGTSEAAARRSAADGIAALRRALGQLPGPERANRDRASPDRASPDRASPDQASPDQHGAASRTGTTTRTIKETSHD